MPGTKNSGRKPNLSKNLTNKNLDRRDKAENAMELNEQFKSISLTPPDGLTESGQAQWKTVVRQFKKVGLLTILDGDLLYEYLMQVDLSRKADENIKQNGIVIDGKKNPAVDVKNNAVKLMKSIGSSIGLDPISRSALLADKPPEDDGETEETIDKFGGGA